jgi:DnaK suppressor protein
MGEGICQQMMSMCPATQAQEATLVVRSQAVLKQMLEDERDRLETQIKHAESKVDGDVGYGNHMADDATEAFEQARDLSVRTRLEHTLHEVQDALGKFDRGTYGICENCGNKIDWARLEAKPEAKLCITCKQRSDFGR